MIHNGENAKPNSSKGVSVEFGELRRLGEKNVLSELLLFKTIQALFETWQ